MRFSVTTICRRIALLFFFLLGFSQAYAQQPTPMGQYIRLSPEDKNRGLNGPQTNFYFATDTSTNYRNAGYFGQKLRPYLADNSEALEFLNDYRRQKSLHLAERLVFVGSVALYGQQVLAGDERQYFNNTQKVAAGVAVFSLIANVLISRNTNTHLLRAVETHNSMFPAARHGALWQRYRPTTVGMSATATGRPLLALSWQLH
ncbi:hypothetical protein F1C16_14690 [Hymenobacter sp. NBH84]|uniref:hypothetical protein n=1 Tax=Hymenobacter sp. NBH84 TaxID=2596915 RepID=UPI00162422B0|nr:hypothetical protein [Hymenobacter sp. NBH84]QNE40724.1 hypothetical protein F1C16_14690 [Hymenobacter sp. NBH84]